jgi:hypothetical protein
MEAFWEMTAGWSPIGQGIVMLVVFFIAVAFLEQALHYLTIMLRGWPDTFVQRGELTVVQGQHEVAVRTTLEPSEVWVNLEHDGCTAVCQGNVNRAGVTINEHGFVLNLDIQSTECRLKWRAEF